MRKIILGAAFLMGISFFTYLQLHPQPVINYSTLVSGLSDPVDIANAGDGTNRLYIVQQNGVIRIWDGSNLLPNPFLDISNRITASGGEQGLLSMAFHPDYAVNHYFFVYYTNISGDVTVARYTRNNTDVNAADTSSGVVLIAIPKPGTPYFQNHNGGKLIFGPDGMLYFGTGDGGSGGDPFNNAQSGFSLRGKMFRLDVSNFSNAPYYFIPPDNPYISSGTVDHRLYAIGLRNPFRWSFDRLTGDMWIGDVGQNAWEEVNYMPAGTGAVNYGWRCYEGTHAYNTSGCGNGYALPIFEYPHDNSTGGYCIIGGYVYRGSEFPALYGYYVTLDYISGNVWLIKANGSGGWNITRQNGLPSGFVSFGEAQNGTLYALSKSAGTLNKINVLPVLSITLKSFEATHYTSFNELKWSTLSKPGILRFVVEYGTDGTRFLPAGQVKPDKNDTINSYSFKHYNNSLIPLYYRLAIEEDNGITTYSSIIKVKGGGDEKIMIYPSIISNGIVIINLVTRAIKMQIISSNGNIVFEKSLSDRSGIITVNIPFLSKGVYMVLVLNREMIFKEKIVIE